jgi:hypothetical protein
MQMKSLDTQPGNSLITASLASRGVARLRVGSTFLGFTTLNHHLCEVDVTTARILVEGLTRVVAGGIWGVSEESLERVEVHWRTRGVWVPCAVDFLLGLVVPHLVVILVREKAPHVRMVLKFRQIPNSTASRNLTFP